MSSKRRLRRKSCTGKQRHTTVSQGYGHIAHLRKTLGAQGNLHVYQCTFCSFFHVGHASKRQTK